MERKGRPRGKSKWEAVSLKEKAKETVLTVDELENALRDLFLECVTFPFPETTLSRLAVYKDTKHGCLHCWYYKPTKQLTRESQGYKW